MSYGRSRYFFFDDAEPVDADNLHKQARLGVDLEEIQIIFLIWDQSCTPNKHKEYHIYFKNKVEPIRSALFSGGLIYKAWREYCEAKVI